VLRLVFDLEGTGPAPTAQLGRGSDGDYLSVAGISADPARVSAFTPVAGPLAGLTTVPGDGLSVRINLKQTQAHAMGYLTGPSRLVIDFTSS
jgi:hypothetical protein